jgi:7-cyano-7-deazaguanine synthase
MTKKSVILLSGGLDSAANLALSVQQDNVLLALTARYGQRAAQMEARAARELCLYYGVKHQIIELDWLGDLGGSSLTDTGETVPQMNQSDLDNLSIASGAAKSVWVPNRNGVLINVAASFAERVGAEQIVVGFNREEAATFPDNSAAFLEKATAALAYSTANHVKVVSYTTELNKIEIVAKLRALSQPFPFDKIWSCYLGGSGTGKSPCGHCESCQRLQRALEA